MVLILGGEVKWRVWSLQQALKGILDSTLSFSLFQFLAMRWKGPPILDYKSAVHRREKTITPLLFFYIALVYGSVVAFSTTKGSKKQSLGGCGQKPLRL